MDRKSTKRVINSSKRSTYDPRKSKEATRKKSFAIRKRYKKLKEKIGDLKTYDLHDLEEQRSRENNTSVQRIEEKLPCGDDGHRNDNDGSEVKKQSRTKQRKKMFKKTRSGQPVMKFRLEKILKTIEG